MLSPNVASQAVVVNISKVNSDLKRCLNFLRGQVSEAILSLWVALSHAEGEKEKITVRKKKKEGRVSAQWNHFAQSKFQEMQNNQSL